MEQNTRPWTKKENEILANYINSKDGKGSEESWGAVAHNSGLSQMGRNGASCRDRWFNHLNPKINKEPLTNEEKDYILKRQSEIGNQWSEIAKRLPGRTDLQVKNFFYGRVPRKARQKGGDVKVTRERKMEKSTVRIQAAAATGGIAGYTYDAQYPSHDSRLPGYGGSSGVAGSSFPAFFTTNNTEHANTYAAIPTSSYSSIATDAYATYFPGGFGDAAAANAAAILTPAYNFPVTASEVHTGGGTFAHSSTITADGDNTGAQVASSSDSFTTSTAHQANMGAADSSGPDGDNWSLNYVINRHKN